MAIVGSVLPTDSSTASSAATPLKIGGNRLPSISMPVQSRLEKLNNAREVIRGVKKRFEPGRTYPFHGVRLTGEEIIARFEAQLVALDAVRAAWAAWQKALGAERKLRKPLIELTTHLKRLVLMQWGPQAFVDFGWEPPKKPGPKTVKAKLAGVEKRRKNKQR